MIGVTHGLHASNATGFSDARHEAFVRLLSVEQHGTYVGSWREGEDTESRQKRQTLRYVAGITRMRRRLDQLLAHSYRGRYAEMEPALKIVLRIGLYDMLFLNTPAYAAINEAVSLAKRVVRPGVGRLANGVLRHIDREWDRMPDPDTGDEVEDLAVLHSHPTWMVRRWFARYGRRDTEALLEWNNARPAFCVRINTLRIEPAAFLSRLDALGVPWEPTEVLPYLIRVPWLQPLIEHGLLHSGLCAVQDESAALMVLLLDPQPGEHVVDVCSAPGGKALHAAQRMQNQGRLVAMDVCSRRLDLVEEGARIQHAGVVETCLADARRPDHAWERSADRVLVDAPCSGWGVLAKRADLRWRRTPKDLEALAWLQDEILDAASHLVRPGGTLVYGTCTIEPGENAERVEAFLERHPAFERVDARGMLPDRLVTSEGFYASFPPRDGMDGVFGARFRRNGQHPCGN